ncbi:MAG: sulfotransferase [Planctomycetaceae bacterium]|nr:hypothetical protein [Planctomycetaceae bacterium]MDG2391825.1 sulfotransferase [Planctomycetaceae bacterium]
MREFNKIHVIALPRCATVSMSEALGQLGIRIAHLGKIHGEESQYHHDNKRLIHMHRQIASGDYNLEILEECDGLADYPACIPSVIEQLDRRYPGSLFINIRRDDEIKSWLQSVERQFVGLRLIKTGKASSVEDRQFADAMADFRGMTFGQTEFEPDPFRDAYWSFQNFVEDYFSEREDDLLSISEMGILQEDGYRRLCEFLDCNSVDSPFPCSNHHSLPPKKAFLEALEQGKIVSKSGIVSAQPVLRK